ncbi:hypothetical protein AMS68_005188 [Peltaster fructicola]|uniref:Uncharacterized protein n=1 Tax=Peltaster fructicola TaxID=286661 RepID=A0A6H0XYD2_9PEZI|nr:hypothetical protein AMS68_005188 [Peltaster fructicola]
MNWTILVALQEQEVERSQTHISEIRLQAAREVLHMLNVAPSFEVQAILTSIRNARPLSLVATDPNLIHGLPIRPIQQWIIPREPRGLPMPIPANSNDGDEGLAPVDTVAQPYWIENVREAMPPAPRPDFSWPAEWS